MLIYLIGFMGSGKSSIGKKVAARMNMNFIDLDDQIEMKGEMSISAYFDKYGETRFRELERLCLIAVSKLQNTVISTGGGTPCFFDNMELILKTGLSIYLNTDPKSLSARLGESKKDRPLLRGMTDKQRDEYVANKLLLRGSFYNRANIIVKGEDLKPKDLVFTIEQYLLNQRQN